MLGSPLATSGGIPALILPRGTFGLNGEKRPAGDDRFEITSTFAEHIASGRGPGIDIGNARCGYPVLAMADGVITFAGQLSTGIGMANVVRVWHPGLSQFFGGKRVESGYAHLTGIETRVGIQVAKGIAIGHHGKSGATACHLHGGVKVGGTATVEGTEIDWWPLLDQNIVGGDMLQGTSPTRIINRQSSIKGAATNFRGDPSTAKPALAQFGAGTGFIPDFSVTGQAVGGSTKWYAGFLPVNGVQTLGYLHESVLNPLSTSESAGGFTQKDLDDAKDAGKIAGAAEREALWEQWNSQAQAGKP